ncbi:hypothetical protein ACP3W1_24155, partial [Salmonella enterica]|uniref:hypothetical protein n=1 Tax=Salmonella enterica TaxID=28901 RepID=UPI003CF297F1
MTSSPCIRNRLSRALSTQRREGVGHSRRRVRCERAGAGWGARRRSLSDPRDVGRVPGIVAEVARIAEVVQARWPGG